MADNPAGVRAGKAGGPCRHGRGSAWVAGPVPGRSGVCGVVPVRHAPEDPSAQARRRETPPDRAGRDLSEMP